MSVRIIVLLRFMSPVIGKILSSNFPKRNFAKNLIEVLLVDKIRKSAIISLDLLEKPMHWRPERSSNLRTGGRRGLLGGHYSKGGYNIDIGEALRKFHVLDKLVETEMAEEVLQNWRTMQNRVVIPPRDFDELSQMTVWEREWDKYLFSW